MDPVTLAVLSARFTAIVEEMGEALLRTAYSQILNSSRDFSIALTDGDCRLVAQADHIPVHVGAMPFAARAVAEAFAGDMRPGDVFLLNDPWHGGSHLPDLTIVLPVFAAPSTAPLFFSVVRAHQSDIGGATHGGYNPAATEIWQEGLRIPPIRLGEGGVLRADLVAMLALNTRIGREFRGDLAAMHGAATLGARRVEALLAQHGAAPLAQAVEEILALSHAHAARIVAAWPDGTWSGTAHLDDDGHGARDVAIRAVCTKRGDTLTVDLSASDDQVAGFVNSSAPNMHSAVCMAFAYLLDPEVAKNDGAFRALRVVAREGSVAWAREGAAVTLCTSHCSNEIVEAVMRAMQHCCPERVMGGWGRRFRIALTGQDARRPQADGGGRRFVWHLFHARPGGGGHVNGDGWPTVGEWHSAGGLKFGSVEMAEARFPLHFRHHEFLAGSAGHGQHRGGHGARLELVVESAGPTRANTAGDGAHHGSAGLCGGKDSPPHRYVLRHADGTERVLRTKESAIVIQPGEVLDVRSAGGGGWGDPALRDPARDAADAADGLL
ncbi:MAG: hydantoinase B/oxoprolinase family protein [Rubritepida sp.]|jgi:N-methylhydantoinase B|nr:hydantoinase B/oxoprolinase family protein [Rubritepida sp.]MCU0945073.1 hydantoinase B/oxoprolinase family protein [Rubritepida sp.]